MKSHKQYWQIGRHPKEDVFKTCFLKLKPEHKWRVHHSINNVMLYSKDPVKVIKHKICEECKDGLVLFGLADDGVGNKGVELMVFLNYKKHVLYPIFCRAVKIKK